MKYIPVNKILFRFPSFPISTIRRAIDNNSFFKEIISDDRFKEAIFFSSPVLYKELENYLDGKIKEKDIEKVENSLIKYLSRMSTRCTPFGGFASCAVGTLEDVTNIELSGEVKYSFRFDMEYLFNLSQVMQKNVEFRKSLRYKINSTIYVLGRRIRYIYYENSYTGRTYKILEFKKNRLIEYIIKQTVSFVRYVDLIDRIVSYFDLDVKDADAYVDNLILNKILISENEPYALGLDYFDYLNDIIKNNDCKSFDYIGALQKEMYDLNKSESFECRKNVVGKICEIVGSSIFQYKGKHLLQMDSVLINQNIRLSSRIIVQIQECMDMLNKVCSYNNSSLLKNFTEKFRKRYGDQEICLLEAIDPNVGVGYVSSQDDFDCPLLAGLALSQNRKMNSYMFTPLQKIILSKMSLKGSNDINVIRILDEDIKGFNGDLTALPVSMAAMFKIVESCDNGDFVLSELRFMGSTAANLLARFAYCDDDIKAIVRSVVNEEKEYYRDIAVAEISHISDFRSGNVIFRPHIRDYEISYLTNSVIVEDNVIPVSDLMVSLKNGNIIIRSKKLNKEVLPRLTSAHNYHNNPTPIYQFLCDLQFQNIRSSLSFSWGMLENILKHFPRVVYRNVILFPEQWRISKSEITDAHGKISIDRIKDVVQKYKISRYVELRNGDNRLFFDFENKRNLKVFAKEVSKYNEFFIMEFIPSNGVSIERFSGESMMNECIIPLIRRI